MPYADNLVNLLVAERLGPLSMQEILRVLVPRGTALIRQDGGWQRIDKPWPKEMDEWTHWLHGPNGNAVAQDRLVGPPRGLQWIAGPLWSRHHNTVPSVTAQVSANGRLFYIVDKAPASMHGSAPDKWVLVARDGFNGLLLWQRPIAKWGWQAWSAMDQPLHGADPHPLPWWPPAKALRDAGFQRSPVRTGRGQRRGPPHFRGQRIYRRDPLWEGRLIVRSMPGRRTRCRQGPGRRAGIALAGEEVRGHVRRGIGKDALENR